MSILLQNKTGRREGYFIRYEYGKELFGDFYLDIIRSKKHRSATLRRHVLKTKLDFILTLDYDIENRKSRHYEQIPCDAVLQAV